MEVDGNGHWSVESTECAVGAGQCSDARENVSKRGHRNERQCKAFSCRLCELATQAPSSKAIIIVEAAST